MFKNSLDINIFSVVWNQHSALWSALIGLGAPCAANCPGRSWHDSALRNWFFLGFMRFIAKISIVSWNSKARNVKPKIEVQLNFLRISFGWRGTCYSNNKVTKQSNNHLTGVKNQYLVELFVDWQSFSAQCVVTISAKVVLNMSSRGWFH